MQSRGERRKVWVGTAGGWVLMCKYPVCLLECSGWTGWIGIVNNSKATVGTILSFNIILCATNACTYDEQSVVLSTIQGNSWCTFAIPLPNCTNVLFSATNVLCCELDASWTFVYNIAAPLYTNFNWQIFVSPPVIPPGIPAWFGHTSSSVMRVLWIRSPRDCLLLTRAGVLQQPQLYVSLTEIHVIRVLKCKPSALVTSIRTQERSPESSTHTYKVLW